VSLVAVVKRTGDLKDQIPSTRIVPVGMPVDMEFSSMFGGKRVRDLMSVSFYDPAAAALSHMGSREIGSKAFGRLEHPSRSKMLRAFLEGGFDEMPEAAPAQDQTTDDLLVSLAGMLEPDRGMPGKRDELRIVNSLATLLFFYEHGNTATSGTFRVHVVKLLRFLTPERLKQLKAGEERAARRVLELLKAARPVPGSWEQFVLHIVKAKRFDISDFWTKVESALAPVRSATVAHD
jgi:hypothetical protein